MKAFTFCNVLFALLKELLTQQKFNKQYLNPRLASLETKCDGHFSNEQLFKIKRYYALFIPTLICSQLKYIYSQRLSEKERARATLFGILTPLYDDLFDLESLSEKDYKLITLKPHEFNGWSFQTRVIKLLQSELINTTINSENYLEACEKVMEAQLRSKNQRNSSISKSDLEKITYDKGGYSMLLYLQLLNPDKFPGVQELAYTLGSVYQLCNDVFDLYKDVRDGIYTLPNTCSDLVALKKNLILRIKTQNAELRQLDLDLNKTRHLLISLNLVNARALVALDHLIRSLPLAAPDPFNYWKSQARHDVIVDMEKPANILKWIGYTYKIAAY